MRGGADAEVASAQRDSEVKGEKRDRQRAKTPNDKHSRRRQECQRGTTTRRAQPPAASRRRRGRRRVGVKRRSGIVAATPAAPQARRGLCGFHEEAAYCQAFIAPSLMASSQSCCDQPYLKNAKPEIFRDDVGIELDACLPSLLHELRRASIRTLDQRCIAGCTLGSNQSRVLQSVLRALSAQAAERSHPDWAVLACQR
jgi:hypothetical protein